jgi:arginase family enzyme
MSKLSGFFNPIDKSLALYADMLPEGSIGKTLVMEFDEALFEDSKSSIVIFGVPEDRNAVNNKGTGKQLDTIRRELYQLYSGNWNTQIIDLGDIKIGDTINDTEVAVKEVVSYLLKFKHLPIILGGSQALTYATYRAFDTLEQKVNLTVVDSKFDLGVIDNHIDSHSYLTKIVMEKPNNLFNFTNIGYQTFLNAQAEINLLDTLLFDAYRLGTIKNDFELVEPILRDTDILSIDIGAVRKVDAPANNNAIISGFDADAICKIARYAGLSDKLSVFGIYEYNAGKEQQMQTAQLIAQMIWYFVEGVNYRSFEFPSTDLDNFKKYMVLVDDETFQFYKSDKTGRWWMEINVKENNKTKRRTLIPCTYNDYLSANRQEIPDRWYLNRRKLS